jgi:hypothetical protein
VKYTQKSFNSPASSESYRDNFDRIFRRCASEYEFRKHTYRCELLKPHEGEGHHAQLVDGDLPSDFIEWNDHGDSQVFETLVIDKR